MTNAELAQPLRAGAHVTPFPSRRRQGPDAPALYLGSARQSRGDEAAAPALLPLLTGDTAGQWEDVGDPSAAGTARWRDGWLRRNRSRLALRLAPLAGVVIVLVALLWPGSDGRSALPDEARPSAPTTPVAPVAPLPPPAAVVPLAPPVPIPELTAPSAPGPETNAATAVQASAATPEPAISGPDEARAIPVEPGDSSAAPVQDAEPQAAPVASESDAAAAAPAVADWSVSVPYRVQPGDDVQALAARFTTEPAAIIRLNGLADGNQITIGETLLIPYGFPQGATGPPPLALLTAATLGSLWGDVERYAVAAGDSLRTIAQRFGTTARVLAAVNDLSLSADLSIGQELLAPVGYLPPSGAPD